MEEAAMYERFTDRARRVMRLAHEEAQNLKHEYIGTEHILLGLVRETSGVAARALRILGVDEIGIRREVENAVLKGSAALLSGNLPLTPRVKKTIEYAVEEARQLRCEAVGSEHLMLGLLREQQVVACQILLNLGLNLDMVRREVLNLLSAGAAITTEPTALPAEADRPDAGRDLTALARQSKLDSVVGRVREIERLVQVLGRRSLYHPVLVGPAGTGKSAIVHGLARVLAERPPSGFPSCRLVEVDLAALLGGGSDVASVLQECGRARNTILFIDDLARSLLSGSLPYGKDALELLRTALASGQIQCISTATPELLQRWLEDDLHLAPKLVPIPVVPLSLEQTVEVLYGQRDSLEIHHRAQIPDSVLGIAAELAQRHLPAALPGAALELLDDACARVHGRPPLQPPDLGELNTKMELIFKDMEIAVAEQDYEKAALLRDQADRLKKKKDFLLKDLQSRPRSINPVVEERDLRETIQSITGKTIAADNSGSPQCWPDLEKGLGQEVIGQDEAIAEVARVLRRTGVGLIDPRRPLGVFLFHGMGGVGKTLLARALAKTLFGSEESFLQLDMGWFRNPDSVGRLLGCLVRSAPVLELGSIEKAHPDVQEVLLRLLETGGLTDAEGRTIDLSGRVLIVTTGLGGDLFLPRNTCFSISGFGRKITSESVKRMLWIELEKHLVSQRWLRAVDAVVLFRCLTADIVRKIIGLKVERLLRRLQDRNVTLLLTEEARELLLEKGFTLEAGAGPLQRALECLLEGPLADLLLQGDIRNGDRITISAPPSVDGSAILEFRTTGAGNSSSQFRSLSWQG